MDDNTKAAVIQSHKYGMIRFAVEGICDYKNIYLEPLETYMFYMKPKTLELLIFGDKLKKALLIHGINYQTMIKDVRSVDPYMADLLDDECNRKFSKSGG